MHQYHYREFIIEISNEELASYGALSYCYVHTGYNGSENQFVSPSSKHKVRVYKDGKETASCFLHGYSGATDVHNTCSVIDDERLLVCCSNTVFCLLLPTLELIWSVRADDATCFQIFKLQDSYVIHGELAITKLNKSGEVLWQFSGADIFVTPDSTDGCVIYDDYILLTDWRYNHYRINFDGQKI